MVFTFLKSYILILSEIFKKKFLATFNFKTLLYIVNNIGRVREKKIKKTLEVEIMLISLIFKFFNIKRKNEMIIKL